MVYRIAVIDKHFTTEADIKIRFNNLCRQFEQNKRYINIGETQAISEDVDISYEMTVNKKRFQASYHQQPSEVNEATNRQKVFEHFQSIYPGLNKNNITTAISAEIELYYFEHYYQAKSVWFMIYEEYGNYKILMFYDNEHNHAKGEDL